MMAGTAFGLTFFLLCIMVVTFASEVKRKVCFVLKVLPHHFNASIFFQKCSFIRNETDSQILFYQLNGQNDTVYYTWSLAGAPTLFVSVTPASQDTDCAEVANNSFDWEEFAFDQSYGSAYIPGYNGSFAFSVVFNRLIEFSDRKYRANKGFRPSEFNNTDRYSSLNMSDLEWTFKDNELTGTLDDFTCVIRVSVKY